MISDKERSKSEEERLEKIKSSTRQATLVNNPCLAEQQKSYKCMNDSGYDRDACSKYFQNYRNCKSFWNYVRRERKKQGIKPVIPPVSEHSAIREQYRDYMPWLPTGSYD